MSKKIHLIYIFSIIFFIVSLFLYALKGILDFNFTSSIASYRFSWMASIMHAPIDKMAYSFARYIFHIMLAGIICFIGFCIVSKLFMRDNLVLLTNKNIKIPMRKLFIILIALLQGFYMCYAFSTVIFKITSKVDTSKVTDLYAKEYVNPKSIKINPIGATKNCIILILESMETLWNRKTYNSKIYDFTPELTNLAQDPHNLSFIGSDSLGEAFATYGTDWTTGFLWAISTGVHWDLTETRDYRTPFYGYYPGLSSPHLYTLFDILRENQYHMEFICGSIGTFGGRAEYMAPKGVHIYDYAAAIKDEWVHSEYDVHWGIEDRKLFTIAKQRIRFLSNITTPYLGIILTTDTHAPHGFICPWCPQIYDVPFYNTLRCSSRLSSSFIEWLKSQPFMKNTVLIVVGDHPYFTDFDYRYDYNLEINDKDHYRSIYMNVINSDVESPLFKRTFTTMDLFPSILHLLGFEIEGDKLALGTNIFSQRHTLLEKMGMEKLNIELAKYAPEYYKIYF